MRFQRSHKELEPNELIAALSAIADLMDAEKQKTTKASAEELEEILAQVVPPEVVVMEEVIAAEGIDDQPVETLQERIEKPVSRRDLLRGVLMKEGES